MPAISSPATVLVTGPSGYIGAWVAKDLLEKGFTVVGTVRSKEKGEYLKQLFEDKPFSYTIVKDISKSGAFDEVLKSNKFDAIEHVASPFHHKADDPNELIEPAVNGTVGILESAQKHCPSVKRVVVTSSVAAILQPGVKLPFTGDETWWNDISVEDVKKNGKQCTNTNKYMASKALAEKAAWDFVEKNKPSFDLVTVLPSMVFGPTIHEITSAENLNTSVANFYKIMKGNYTRKDLPGTTGSNWVDVRDVSKCHIESLLVEQAAGKRILALVAPYNSQQFVEILNAYDPSLKLESGKPGGATISPEQAPRYDASRTGEILGVKFNDLKTTVIDMYEDLKKREESGWKSL